MPAGSQCAKTTLLAANTTTTLTTIRATTASSRAAAAATHIANTMNVAAKHSSSPATSKARLHAPAAAACWLVAAAHCARPSIQKSMFLTLLVVVSLCANCAVSSPMQLQQQQQQPEQQHQQQQQQQSTIRVQQCREGCFEKFATKEMLCQQNAECLTCWDECAKPPPPKINKSIRETWSLHTVSMLQQDSLVLVDVAWAPLSTPNQCLVTWEVSGGGLMGNLLTESFNVQLSLWPDTKYRVQVTCKNKLTGTMSRSLPLTIDTAEAVSAPANIPQQKQPPTISNAKHLPTADIIDSHGNNNIATNDDAIDDMNAALPAAADAQDIASVLPYEEDDLGAANDQSAESISQHTNFIFNWHAKNSDISAIEPLQKPDLNILTLAALSDMQKPLLFGVVAGTLLLVFVLLMYVCMMRQQRLPGDKAALIAEDAHAVVVSLPPAAAAALAATASTSANAATMCYSDEGCRNPAICSRNALKV